MRIITEPEFRVALFDKLLDIPSLHLVGSVTGPGRSGAIAAAFASHMLGIPFIPFKQKPPERLGYILILDTAMESGATMRKAVRWYNKHTAKIISLAIYYEPPRVAFWYEAAKPQFYRHERRETSHDTGM